MLKFKVILFLILTVKILSFCNWCNNIYLTISQNDKWIINTGLLFLFTIIKK